MSSLAYRSDIDGLRAVAVLVVIGFHAYLEIPGHWFGLTDPIGLTGGYVGVDVFFVISGFLITSLILRDLDQGRFSFVDFWKRRIRRIWPASLAMTLVILLIGLVIAMPVRFEAIADAAMANTLMVSNFYFTYSSGYFHHDAETRPFLHTWSLAVEEQFYMLFPFVMFFAYKLGRRGLFAVLALIAVASFILSVMLLKPYPTETFYLLPTRAWELAIGALLAFIPARKQLPNWVVQLMALMGMALILGPCLVYIKWTSFPGENALPPCLGAAMIIYAGACRSTLISRMLSVTPMRMIGLMSYSLYLWHWPVLAYLTFLPYEVHTWPYRVFALSATLVLGFCSWKFIETPFRQRTGNLSMKRIGGAAVLASLILIGLSVTIQWLDGIPQRYDKKILIHASPESFEQAWNQTDYDRTVLPIGLEPSDAIVPTDSSPRLSDRPDFLLWGDSHGMAISRVVDELAKNRDLRGQSALRIGTLPVPGIWRPYKHSSKEAAWCHEVLTWTLKHRPRYVILIGRWSVNLDGEGRDRIHLVAPLDQDEATSATTQQTLATHLTQLIEQLIAHDIQPIILTEPPLQAETPEKRAFESHLLRKTIPQVGVDRETHQQHQASVQAVLATVRSQTRVMQFDLARDAFSTEGRSQVALEDGTSLYADDDHLNTPGVHRVAQSVLEEVLDQITTDPQPATRPTTQVAQDRQSYMLP